MFKQHTEPHKAGVCRLLSTRMALGFQPQEPEHSAQELPAELEKCGKWRKLNAYLSHTQFCCCFYCSYDKRCECFESVVFLYLSLVISFHNEKEERELTFYQVEGKARVNLFLVFKRRWRDGKREWEITGYLFFLLVLLLHNPCVLHSCLLFSLLHCTIFFSSVFFAYFSDASIKS